MKNISKSTGYLIVAAFWLSICLLWSTKTQAQTLCDVGVYTTGSQFQMEVVIGVTGNSLPMMAPIYVVTYGGSSMPWNVGNQPMLAEDSCFGGPCTQMVFNYNPSGNPYDTLMTCIFYELTDSIGNIDTLMCCDDWVWDGSSVWFKLGAQQQNFSCDSLSYTVLQGLPLTVYGEASGIINMVDSIEWLFSACNSVACYTPQGNNPYSFPQINMTDTVKFCYDAYIYTPNQMIVCLQVCDSLIFDYTDSTYVLFNMGGTTSINELILNKINNNKIYDLLGRELIEIPVGKMYIRNNKLYINK